MTSIRHIKNGIVEVLKLLKVANGYSIDMPNGHIYPYISQPMIDDDRDSTYPKVFIGLENKRMTKQAAGDSAHEAAFTLYFLLKPLVPSDTSAAGYTAAAGEKLLEDVSDLFYNNSTLADTVTDSEIASIVSDDGIREPEAVVVAILMARVQRSGYDG